MIEALAPRSTCSHCGSENALDQRVPVLPSTAFEAGNEAFSTDDAVAGWPCDSNVAAALARLAGPATNAKAATSAATAAKIQIRRGRTAGTHARTGIHGEPLPVRSRPVTCKMLALSLF